MSDQRLDETPSDEQSFGESEQSAADSDQALSDHDQAASDADEISAAEDQRVSDAALARGAEDAVEYLHAVESRARTSADRAAVSRMRSESAAARLATGAARDEAARQRDRLAEERDEAALLDDLSQTHGTTTTDLAQRASRIRRRAATDRQRAASDRAQAAADREAAAAERAELIRDHHDARLDLIREATDELTGAWTRRFGLASLTRELERACRVGHPLVLAFIDVDDLKQVNDSDGHAAGDQLLRLVSATIRSHVRPYDVLVRYGGDEFLCAMPHLEEAATRIRLGQITADLTARGEHPISYGVAALGDGDTLDTLIARADADLLRRRTSKR